MGPTMHATITFNPLRGLEGGGGGLKKGLNCPVAALIFIRNVFIRPSQAILKKRAACPKTEAENVHAILQKCRGVELEEDGKFYSPRRVGVF